MLLNWDWGNIRAILGLYGDNGKKMETTIYSRVDRGYIVVSKSTMGIAGVTI